METQLQKKDLKKIKEGIRQKYAKVSISPEGLFKYPTGRDALEALEYDSQKVAALPTEAIASYCGVGNPFSIGPVRPGEEVLDIGCGGGLDSLVASLMVGPSGKVTGIEISAEMVARARENLRLSNLSNVEFLENTNEILPFPDDRFDVVISNGVFNLIPDKLKALQEVRRVLKTDGRLMMADQILTGTLTKDRRARIDSWFR